MFIRVDNSERGVFDVALGPRGTVLVSNGLTVAPSFQDPPIGFPPRGFSYTQEWEKEHLDNFSGYDFGIANFTAEFERASAQSSKAHGPANYTTQGDSPWARRP